MKNENLNGLDVTSMSRNVALAPTDFIFKIQSFSSLGWTTSKVESGIFESGGYKWRLRVSSSGSKYQGIVGNYISLYLSLADTDKLPSGWEIRIYSKFFIFNQIKNEYISLQDDGKVCHFHFLKTECGYDQFLPMSTFSNPKNGYLMKDSCVFGAEIYVIKPNNATFELMDLSTTIDSPIFTWKIDNFSDPKTKLSSPEFVIGGRKWILDLYPNGIREEVGKSISLYLVLVNMNSLGGLQLEAKFKLRIIDQVSGGKTEREACTKFPSSMSDSSSGFTDFLSLENLNDATKKYLLDDTVLVEVEFLLLQMSRVFIVADAPYSPVR